MKRILLGVATLIVGCLLLPYPYHLLHGWYRFAGLSDSASDLGAYMVSMILALLLLGASAIVATTGDDK